MTGDDLREYMNAQELTTTELAELCGVDPRTVRYWLSNKAPIPKLLDELLLMNSFLGRRPTPTRGRFKHEYLNRYYDKCWMELAQLRKDEYNAIGLVREWIKVFEPEYPTDAGGWAYMFQMIAVAASYRSRSALADAKPIYVPPTDDDMRAWERMRQQPSFHGESPKNRADWIHKAAWNEYYQSLWMRQVATGYLVYHDEIPQLRYRLDQHPRRHDPHDYFKDGQSRNAVEAWAEIHERVKDIPAARRIERLTKELDIAHAKLLSAELAAWRDTHEMACPWPKTESEHTPA